MSESRLHDAIVNRDQVRDKIVKKSDVDWTTGRIGLYVSAIITKMERLSFHGNKKRIDYATIINCCKSMISMITGKKISQPGRQQVAK